MIFELAEWLGAVTLAPDFADSYLGQQGDAWNAHKDMGLAAVVSMFIAAMVQHAKGDANLLAADTREYKR